MPVYVFDCKNCEKSWEEVCSFDERALVYCPTCQTHPTPVMTCPRCVIFKQPKGTSFEDKFEYVAQWNMDNAKEIRRQAEAKTHMGTQPYKNIDDISSGEYFGEVE